MLSIKRILLEPVHEGRWVNWIESILEGGRGKWVPRILRSDVLLRHTPWNLVDKVKTSESPKKIRLVEECPILRLPFHQPPCRSLVYDCLADPVDSNTRCWLHRGIAGGQRGLDWYSGFCSPSAPFPCFCPACMHPWALANAAAPLLYTPFLFNSWMSLYEIE